MLATGTSKPTTGARRLGGNPMFFTSRPARTTTTTTTTTTTLTARREGEKLARLFCEDIPRPRSAGEYEKIIAAEMAAVYDERVVWITRPWRPQVW